MDFKKLVPWFAVIAPLGILSGWLLIVTFQPETCETLKTRSENLKADLGRARVNYSGEDLQDKETSISNQYDEVAKKWKDKQCPGYLVNPVRGF